MKLTQVLNARPLFRFWKEFGEGKNLKKRLGYFNQWQYMWNAYARRMTIADRTLPQDVLPPGSKIMNAEDFLVGHIDAMPDELMKIKDGEKVVYDHPWPYNVQVDPIRMQEPIYFYSIYSRLFDAKNDASILAHTLIETESMEAHPPLEPLADHIEQARSKIDWATSKDSVLVRLPKKREHPKINIKPRAKYGITEERAETNVLKSLAHYTQEILASRKFEDRDEFNKYLNLNVLSYPKCRLLLERDSMKIGMDLFIDHMTVDREPLPLVNGSPSNTISREMPDIRPRTWRSIIEQTRNYSDDWSFKFPSGSYPRTIYLASRIKRNLSDDDMFAKNLMHGYGLARQIAQKKQQDLPIALQIISFRNLPRRTFFFTRFQLNTLEFDKVKNQVWHSGPVEDVTLAFRYFLDFEDVKTTQREDRKKEASM